MSQRIFVDTNILLDVLLERAPFWEPAQTLWLLAEKKKIQAAVSVTNFNNIFYILKKYGSTHDAYEAIAGISKIFSMVELTPTMIHQAMTLKYPDFEDALQYQSALRFKAHAIITRDPEGFKESKLPVLNASQFLSESFPDL